MPPTHVHTVPTPLPGRAWWPRPLLHSAQVAGFQGFWGMGTIVAAPQTSPDSNQLEKRTQVTAEPCLACPHARHSAPAGFLQLSSHSVYGWVRVCCARPPWAPGASCRVNTAWVPLGGGISIQAKSRQKWTAGHCWVTAGGSLRGPPTSSSFSLPV